MKEHLHFLGLIVRDRVTGFEGVVSTIGYDLYGCVQAVVCPQGVKEDGKLKDQIWFDIKRLTAISGTPVMEQPTFDVIPGGDNYKPIP